MSKRRPWSPLQDEILKILIDQRKISKWVEISLIMNKEYGIQNRTGKQCRDRYVNQLAKSQELKDWQVSEDRTIIQMHYCYGSRWALIAKKLQGRTENSIKNRFYSRLRKSIRDINKMIRDYFSDKFITLKSNFLQRLIKISCEKFKENTSYDQDRIEKALHIIKFLFWGTNTKELEQIKSNEIGQHLEIILSLGGIEKRAKQEVNQSGPKFKIVQLEYSQRFPVFPFFICFKPTHIQYSLTPDILKPLY